MCYSAYPHEFPTACRVGAITRPLLIVVLRHRLYRLIINEAFLNPLILCVTLDTSVRIMSLLVLMQDHILRLHNL